MLAEGKRQKRKLKTSMEYLASKYDSPALLCVMRITQYDIRNARNVVKRHFLTPIRRYDKMFLNNDVPVCTWLRDKKWFEERENGIMRKLTIKVKCTSENWKFCISWLKIRVSSFERTKLSKLFFVNLFKSYQLLLSLDLRNEAKAHHTGVWIGG